VLSKKRVQLQWRREELRRAFAELANFELRLDGRQRWSIWTKGGLKVGVIHKECGGFFWRTLGVLIDGAKMRTLQQVPYPAKAQTRRGLRSPVPTPADPPASPDTLLLPRSVADASPVSPDEQSAQ
jgi:hypothetical protein